MAGLGLELNMRTTLQIGSPGLMALILHMFITLLANAL